MKKPLSKIAGVMLLLLFIVAQQTCFAQDKSKNSIKVGLGAGMSEGNTTEGLGTIITLGYQRDLLNDRLRLNPNLSFGYYNSKRIDDSNDQYFNSINLSTNIYYDLIRYKSISLVVGTGVFVNNTQGLNGTGGDTNNVNQHSAYISEWHFGGFAGAGVRLVFPGDRIALNLLPVNIHIGSDDFIEFHAKAEIDIRL